MSEVQIGGVCPPRFDAVRRAFADNFAAREEHGARFTVVVEGEVLLDVWGGSADRAGKKPFDDKTLAPVFSSTKALASLVVAQAVGRGSLDYGRRASDLWPEFGQAGKDGLRIEQVLSHQAGLSGFREPFEPELWYDWDAICAKLAAMEPLWPPGTASGYHPSTFGFLAGELFRRAEGRTIGRALRDDLAGPFGLDLFIGLPESEDHRVADILRPKAMPDLGELTEPRRLAFMVRWATADGRDPPRWRRAELPSSNGHATALGLAMATNALACDGELQGREVLPPGAAAEAARARIRGPDKVLPYDLAWGAGFLRNDGLGIYGPSAHAFGHSGWGGSCVFADPERRLSAAYVMNRQSQHLIGDPRPRSLIDALYAAL